MVRFVFLKSTVRYCESYLALGKYYPSSGTSSIVSKLRVLNDYSQFWTKTEDSSWGSTQIRELAVSDSNQASLGGSHQSYLVGTWKPSEYAVLNQEPIALFRKRDKHGWLNHLSSWVANESAIPKGDLFRVFKSEEVGEHRGSHVELPE